MKKEKSKLQHPEYVKAPMSRRTFFRRVSTASGVAAGASYLALAPENWPLSMRDEDGLNSVPKRTPFTLPDFRVEKPVGAADVGVARGTPSLEGEFSDEALMQLLSKAIDAVGGLRHYVQPGDIVLVKPNVAFDRSPNLGATSNPRLLETLVKMLLVDCRAQEVRVADNPIESPPDCFEKSKIRLATERGGGRIYLPDSNAFKTLHTPGARLIEYWSFFHRPFTNVDKVIGLSPVKDHNLCHASMGIKNWYGLLGGTRNQFHQDINEIVSDLSIMIRPTLTIIDGTKVLMENGPTGGDPSNVKQGNMVMAGVDPVALDAYTFEYALERGRDYPLYLQMAEAKGGGILDWTGRVREITG